jgi:hypothetical protein
VIEEHRHDRDVFMRNRHPEGMLGAAKRLLRV